MEAPDQTLLTLAGLALLLVVVLVVARPLLRPEPERSGDDERRAALEAAKEAKYREIRDAELDYRMGKLSEADYRTTDRELRGQAIELLKRLDELEGRDSGSSAGAGAAPDRGGSPRGR